MRAFLQIRAGDDETTVELPPGRAVVGSGADADVVLPSDGAIGPTHFTVEATEDGCLVELAAGAPTSIRVEGMTHESGVLPWGSEIRVGAVVVRLDRDRTPPRRPSLILMIAPFVLGVALWSLSSEREADTLAAAPEAPALFDEGHERCESGRGPAHARAQRDEQAARAKLQRYPFDAADGVEAVRLFRHARACFDASGDAEAAGRAGALAEGTEARVTSDYETARFRLGRALVHEDRAGALAQATRLLELLSGRADPYVEWLSALERRLRLGQAAE